MRKIAFAWVLSAVICLRPGTANAIVEGATPAPFDSHRVFGDGVAIGNTLMANPPPNVFVNTILLDESSASLNTIPDDAVPQSVYVWWSGNVAFGQGAGFIDDDALFVAADGASTNLVADQCRFINANFDSGNQLGFYYCRADVTAFVTAHPGAFSYNGTYTVGDVIADVGRIDPAQPTNCAGTEMGLCQAKYAAWSMVFVYDSPTETLQRDVILYDGFVHMDETQTSLGIVNFNISGFLVGTPPAAEITYFGLEGDRQLGADPGGHCSTCPDFFRVNGTGLQDGFNPIGNTYNSSIALGLDIDEFNIGSTGGGLGVLDTGSTSASIQTGVGDAILDGGQTGESVFLGYVFLRLNRPSPNFRGPATTKLADPPSAATGETVFYSVNIANQGSLAATNVRFTDVLPAGLAYQAGSLRIDGVACTDGADADACTVSAGTLTVNLGTLPATGNNDRLVSFRGTLTATGVGAQVCNVGTVTSNETPTPAEVGPACTTLETAELGQPSKTDVDLTGGVTGPDDVVQYTITIPGDPNSASSGVIFEDDVPANVQLLGFTSPGGTAVDESTFTGGANGNGRVRFSNISIPAGGTATVTMTVQIDSEAEFAADGIAADAIHGRAVCNQGEVSAGFLPASLPTNDPATGAAQDPTCLTLTYAPILSGSSKTVVDDNGGLLEPGNTITYTISLVNSGNRPATIDVTDSMPPGVEGFTLLTPIVGSTFTPAPAGTSGTGLFTADDLLVGAGTTVQIRFRLSVRADAPDGLVIQNSAAITVAERPAENRTLTSPPLTVFARPDLTGFTKTVTDVNGAPARPGDTLSYTLAVTNTGNRPATNVVITDVVPLQLTNVIVTSGGGTFDAGTRTITWSAANLAVGATLTVSFTAVIVTPIANGTVISNQAFIDSAEAPPAEPSDNPATAPLNDPTRVTVVSTPDLSGAIKMVADLNGAPFEPGDVVEYTLTITNTGSAIANAVVVRDTVDTNLTTILPLDGGTLAVGQITWNLGNVAPGDVRTVRFRASIRTPLLDGTVISNQGRITSPQVSGTVLTDDPGTAAVDDPTRFTVESEADFSTSTISFVDVNGGSAQPGDQFDYTVTVLNTGNSPATTVVTTVPANINFATVTPLDGGVFNALTRTITWTLAGPLAPGAAPVLLRFTGLLAPAIADGTVICEAATIDSVQSAPFTTAQACFTIDSRPDLAASEKTVVDVNGGDVSPGDLLIYSIEVINDGTEAANNVVVTDVVSVSLTNVVPANGGVFNAGTRTITWVIPSLSALTATTLTFNANVVSPLDDGTSIANQGSLTCTGCPGPELTDDPATAAPDDPTVVVVGAAPTIVVRKTVVDVDGGAVEPGDALTWTIVVENTGDSCADDVVVVDPIDANLGGVVPQQGGVFDAGAQTVTWTGAGTPALVRLCPGAANAVTLVVGATIDAPLADGTAVCDQARASSDEVTLAVLSDDPATAAANDPTCVTVVSAAQLTGATKTVVDTNGAPARPGDTLAYTIAFTNEGNANAVNVVVRDPIDPSLTNVVPGQGGAFAGSEIRWDATTTPALASVAPGQTVTLTFTAAILTPLVNGTVIINQAEIDAAQGVAIPVLTDDPTTAAPDDPTLVTVTSAALVSADKTVVDENAGVAAPGDVFLYTITLSNAGDAIATNVAVRDVLDANLDFIEALDGGVFDAGTQTIAWNLAQLAPAPAAPVVLRFRAAALSPLPGGTVIANQASLTIEGDPTVLVSDDPSTATPDDPTIVVIVAAPALTESTKVVLGALADGTVTPGTILTYELRALNTGDASATGVVVTDPVDVAHLDQITPLDGGTFDAGTGVVTWNVGTVLPGAFALVRFTARVRLDVPDAIVIDNQGSITSVETPAPALTDDPADPELDDPTEVVTEATLAPVLETSKTVVDVDGGVVQPADELVYTLSIANSGTVASAATTLFDALPAQTQYVLGSTRVNGVPVPDAGGGPASPLMVPPGVALGPLAPGATASASFRVRVVPTAIAGTIISNQAQVADDGGRVFLSDDPTTAAEGDATQVIVGGGALLTSTTKSFDATPIDDDGDGVFEAGEAVQFRIRVQNSGDAPARDVVVSDALPATATFVAGSLALDGTALTDGADGDAGEVVGGQLIVRAGDLAPDVTREVSFQVRIAAGATQVANQGQVDSDDTAPELTDADGNDANGDQVTVVPVGASSGVRIEKGVQDLNGGTVGAGDTLAYTLSITNDGPTPVTGVRVQDEIPAFLGYVAGSTLWPGAPPDPFVAGPPARLDMPGLALEPGETVHITFRADVATGAGAPPDGEVICNRATTEVGGEIGLSNEACVTIGQIAGTASLRGRAYVDALPKNRSYEEALDEALPDLQIVLYTDDAPGAQPVAGAVTDGDGLYRFDGLPPGVYSLRASSPSGAQWARQTGLTVPVNASLEQDVWVDPSGRTYNALSGDLVAGVQVLLRYDAEDAQEPNALVPADRLQPGQQGQTTGANGIYRFDVLPGRKYKLEIDASTSTWSFPSQITPPTPGFAPPGPVVPDLRPTLRPDAPRTWYTRFDIAAAGDDVTNNHVPLDPLTSQVRLDKRADRPDATLGEIVTYTITVQNRSARDLTAASGQPVYVLDAPARGLTYLPGHAVAQIERGLSASRLGGFLERRDGRQVRFGPFDVEAGATLTLVYQVVVGVDTREGIYENRAVAIDAGGAELSNEDRVRLRVKNDPIFDEGLLVGRVFCDADGDGRGGPKERGVMGARIYIDTGSYAVSDSKGRWHLSAIDPGVHMVKIDRNTLPGGSSIADERESEVIYFTRGFTTRVDFPVTCGQTSVITTTDPEGSIKLSGKTKGSMRPKQVWPRTSTTIAGDVGTMALSVDGKRVAVPTVDLTLVLDPALELPRAGGADGRPNLVAPPNGAGWSAPLPIFRGRWDGAAKPTSWTLAIRRVEATGELKLVKTLRGQGAPADVAWNGTDEDGKSVARDAVYVGQLRVQAEGDVEASSARVSFGVAYGLPLAPERVETLRGPFFIGGVKKPRGTKALTRQVQGLAKRIGAEDTLVIEVHADGTGDRLKRIAETQKQADVVKALLAKELGLSGAGLERIKARGRGSLDPIAGTRKAKDKAQNRRVIVHIVPPPPKVAGAPVPDAPAGAADALVLGDAATLDEAGRFVKNVPTPADGRILVDLQATDGRRVAMWIVVPPPPGAGARPVAPPVTPRSRRVVGDVATGALSIDGVTLDAALAGLAAIDVGLEKAAPGSEPNYKILPPKKARKLVKLKKVIPALPARLEQPLRFEPVVPAAVEPARWVLVVTAEGAAPGQPPLHRAEGVGLPPPVLEWKGADDAGVLKVKKGGRYQYRFLVEDARGNRGESPLRTFVVGAVKAGGFPVLVVKGKGFTAKNEPGARVKNLLARFATAVRKRPAGETYKISIVTVTGKTQSSTDLRLASGAREARVRAYMTKLKIPVERVELTTTIVAADAPKAERKESLTITAIPAPVAAPPRLMVAGEPVGSEANGTTFSTATTVPKGGGLVIEMVRPSGQRAVWILPEAKLPAPANAPNAPSAPAPAPAKPPAPAPSPATPSPSSSRAPYEEDNLMPPTGQRVDNSGTGEDNLMPPTGQRVDNSGTGEDALLPPDANVTNAAARTTAADARLERGPTATLSLADDADEFGGEELENALADPDAVTPRGAGGPSGGRTGARAGRLILSAGTNAKIEVPAEVLAADLTIDLPPRGLKLAAPDLWVTGRTNARNRVRMNGREIHVRKDGTFDELVTLPMGDSTLLVEAVDPDDNVAQIAWPVRVAESQQFLLVLADGAISSAYATGPGAAGDGWTTDGAELDGMTDATTLRAGHVLFHGRVALYYKARLKGGDFFKKYDVTAHVDTARRAGFEEFFQNTLDPTCDYAVYGDSATEVRDANARGKLYILVEADDSKAIVGNFKTDLRSGGELFRYDRTVYGAAVDFKKDFGGALRLRQEAKVFGSTGDGRLARDVNLFRATGGSLYYLRHGRLVEGSERVRVIVRDRDNGLVLSERALGRDVDYVIDPTGGRVMFKAPIASTADASFLIDNLDSSQTPLDGHPVYVEVTYEYQPDEGDGGAAAGVYVKDTLFDTLAIGAGVLGEGRSGDGGLGDYTLAGADVTWKPGKRTTLRAELARSTATDADNFISMDGGLSFQGLNAVGLTTADAGRGGHSAWKIEVDTTLGDFADAEWAESLRVRAYAQELDRGFYSGGTILEQGRQKYGVLASYALTAIDTLTFRHDADLATVPRVGPSPETLMAHTDPLALDERESHITTLQWARTGKKLGYKVELAHHGVSTTAGLPDGTNQVGTNRYGVGGQVTYRASKRLVLRAGQEFQFTDSNRDPTLTPMSPTGDPAIRTDEPLAGVATSVGADWELAKDLHVSGTVALRWNGDTAAQIGLKTPVGDTSSMYATQRAESRDGRLVSTSIVGAEDRFGASGGGKAYGEYQLESGMLGVRNRAVLGVGHRWTVAQGWNIAAGFEHQQTFGGTLPDGTPTGRNSRDVVHVGTEILKAERWKASSTLELRYDEGVAGQGLTGTVDPKYADLIKDDPRGVTPPGTFPEHGGTAPGSPLVLPSGRRLQVVASLAGDWKWSEDLTFLGRFRLAHTEDITNSVEEDEGTLPVGVPGEFTAARFVEATAGWAYRPLRLDWLDLLFRYSFLLDMRPIGARGESIENRSHVLALAPIIQLPANLKLSGKLAWKRTETDAELLAEQVLSARTDALLFLARLSWGFYGKWDVALEYRALRLERGEELGAEQRQGVLFEIDYNVSRYVRLGVGWNFSHFSDDELAELERDTHGFFFRVVGRF